MLQENIEMSKTNVSKHLKSNRLTIPSKSWSRRNDSSHVSSLLTANSQQNLLQQHTKLKSKKNTKSDVKNVCYCKKPKVKPLASAAKSKNGNTNEYICYECTTNGTKNETFSTVYSSNEESEPEPATLLRYEPQSSLFLKRYNVTSGVNPACSRCDLLKCLEKRRQTYEKVKEKNLNNSIDFETEYLNELFCGNDQRKARLMSCMRVQNAKEFRRSDYLDTHSRDGLQALTKMKHPNHICVHEFKLNKRLIPEPINSDPFGGSCCKLCTEPLAQSSVIDMTNMNGSCLSKSCTVSTKPRSRPVSATVPRVPYKIHSLCDENSTILITNKDCLKSCLGKNADDVGIRLKVDIPTDSYALRFQKGIDPNKI